MDDPKRLKLKTEHCEGEPRKFYKEGVLIYDGEWKNGLRYKGQVLYHGEGKVYHNGALLYDGEWKDNLRDGQGKSYYKSGALYYEGEWKRDGPYGDEGKYYNENGTLVPDGGKREAVFNKKINDIAKTVSNKEPTGYEIEQGYSAFENNNITGDGLLQFSALDDSEQQ